MNKAELKQALLESIRIAYEEKRAIQDKIDELNRQLDDIELQEAGREYLHKKQDEVLSTFAV